MRRCCTCASHLTAAVNATVPFTRRNPCAPHCSLLSVCMVTQTQRQPRNTMNGTRNFFFSSPAFFPPTVMRLFPPPPSSVSALELSVQILKLLRYLFLNFIFGLLAIWNFFFFLFLFIQQVRDWLQD